MTMWKLLNSSEEWAVFVFGALIQILWISFIFYTLESF